MKMFNLAVGFRRFYLLLWKNFILQIRRPVGTVFELLLPLLAVVLVIALKAAVFSVEDKCFVTFEPDPLHLPPTTTVLFYAPNNTEENEIMALVKQRLPQAIYLPTPTEAQMVNLVKEWHQNSSSNNFSARADTCINGFGVVFDNLDGKNLHYTIRPVHEVSGDDSTWDTDDAQPRFQLPGPRVFPNVYLGEGFLHLQNLVGMSIVEWLLNRQSPGYSFVEIPVNTKQFPYPPYERNLFLETVVNILPLLMILSLLYSSGILVKELVLEKSTKMRESMKVMGLSGWILWLTWYIKQFLFLLIAVIIMTILIKVGVFVESNFLVLLVFMVLFLNCLIAWGFLISTFFSNPVIGMLVGFLAWFANFLPYFFLANRYEQLSIGAKIVACFLSNTCVGLGVNVISTLEIRKEGATLSNVGQPVSLDDSFNMGIVFGMLILDSVIYMLIAWYIDTVFPGEYGIPKPFYFFLLPSYWCGQPVKKQAVNDIEMEELNTNFNDNSHEQEPVDLICGISIKGLHKKFKAASGMKVAVDNLYLNMYQDQITVLLGHNGAGKTTTMSMLVGLFPPTSGDAVINGYSILTDMESIRQSLGLCPQHNVLYDRLTVREHLNFFARLKGMSGRRVREEVNSMIRDLQLNDKTNQRSAALSGGQKRKLSVGIALVAGSKFVILDEPTSGMDPYARRATWDLLSKHKKGRTMLLTTHFMDEADLLGDRIAIMAEGQLRCSGSSLFLKSRYGVGYHMVVTKEEHCNSKAVIDNVASIVPGGKMTSDVGAELSFILPSTMASKFPTLFDILEAQKKQLGISGFGISITTMEEVFIKVGENNMEELARVESKSIVDTIRGESALIFDDVDTDRNTGIVLWFQQFYALLVKRFLHSLRNWRAIITQIIIPIVFITAGLILIETIPGVTSNDQKRLLSFPLSALQEDRSIIFYTELGGNDSIFKNNRIMEYLSAIGATDLTDISQQIQALVNSTRNRVITDITDCCNYKYQILDTFCSSQSTINLRDTCRAAGDFGYSKCQDCLACRNTFDGHLASCSFPLTRANSYFTADDFCPHPPSISITEPLPVTNPQPLDHMSYFVDEYLIDFADNRIDTSDFFRRYMAGFVISKRENFLTHCGANYSRNISAPLSSLDNKDLMCLMLGYTPIVESTSLFTNTISRQSLLAKLPQNDACNSAPEQPTYVDTTLCMFSKLIEAYRTNSTVKYPSCNSFNLTEDYVFIVDQSSVRNVTNTSGLFRVDGAVRLGSDFVSTYGPNSYIDDSGISENEFVGRQYAPLTEISGVTIFYNNQPYHMSAAALNAFHTIYLRHLLKESGASVTDYTINVNNHPLPRTEEGQISAAENTFLGFSLSTMVIFGLSFLAASFILYPVAEKASKLGLTLLFVLSDDDAEITNAVFMFLPSYAFSKGLGQIHTNYIIREACKDNPQICATRGLIYFDNILEFTFPAIGINIVVMAVEGVVLFILTLLLELNFFVHKFGLLCMGRDVRPAKINPEDDSDVAEEKDRINKRSQGDDDLIQIINLKKSYGGFLRVTKNAVRGLNLGIPKGECFGLLGINGAGKTTTFKMLTGDIRPSSGTATIAGYDIISDIRKVQQHIGYCPQFDALIDDMTAYELLWMYARLRGIPEGKIKKVVDKEIERLDLLKHAKNFCGTYSGGNKRKLSTAIALVGSPLIVFLDEPTTGMDPATRRNLWNALITVIKAGKSIVLTSHSMEECEALCTRLAIMVNGQFKCLGGIQHLKTKFGKGYTLQVKIKLTGPSQVDAAGSKKSLLESGSAAKIPAISSATATKNFHNFIHETFQDVTLIEEHQGAITYQLNSDTITWSQVFYKLEANRERLLVMDYSVSQTTLEQVFLNFAKVQQYDETP